MNLKRIKDNSALTSAVIKKLDKFFNNVDLDTDALILKKEDFGSELTKDIVEAVERYALDKVRPEEDTPEYYEWIDGFGPCVEVSKNGDEIRVEYYFNPS